MENIISFNGKRIAFFQNLKTKHCITTNDFGDMKKPILSQNSNDLAFFLSSFFNVSSHGIFSLEVMHSNQTVFITERFAPKTYKGDAIIFLKKKGKKTNAILAAYTGDCPYVLFKAHNNSHTVTGMIHCGLKSVLSGICGISIQNIINKKFAAEQIKIAIWSGICGTCYEVGNEFEKYFLGQIVNGCLNLAAVIKSQLMEEGTLEKNIEQINICPKCKTINGERLFYSYRGENHTENRNGLFIMG